MMVGFPANPMVGPAHPPASTGGARASRRGPPRDPGRPAGPKDARWRATSRLRLLTGKMVGSKPGEIEKRRAECLHGPVSELLGPALFDCRVGRCSRRSSITDLVIFMLGTGCRISDALAVRWRDVDLVGVRVDDRLVPVVAIGPVVVTVKGEGLVYRARGKTGKDEQDHRLVPLPSFVVDMLALRQPTSTRVWSGLSVAATSRSWRRSS